MTEPTQWQLNMSQKRTFIDTTVLYKFDTQTHSISKDKGQFLNL